MPCFAPLTEGPQSFIDLLPREWGVLTVVDGRTNLREIALELAMSEFDVAKVIYGMLTTGLLDVAEQSAEARNA
jgi:hypothetical protein